MENTIIIRNITRDELLTDIKEIVTQVLQSKLQIDPPKEYLTKKETAALLRISQPTLQRLTISGKIKANRIGRRVLYCSDSVQEAMKRIETLKYSRS
jgi:excisionase family DNA binding protein